MSIRLPMFIVMLSLIMSLSAALPAIAQQAKPQSPDGKPHTTLDAKPVHVACFKNGYGVITMTAQLPAKPKTDQYQITPLINASLGTFWLRWSPSWQVSNVHSKLVDIHEIVPATNVADMLRANLGKKVTLTYDGKTATGIVQSIAEKPQPVANPHFNQPSYHGVILPPPSRGPSDLVLFKTDEGTVAMPLNAIRNFTIADDPALEYEQTRRENALLFTAKPVKNAAKDKAAPSIEMNMLAQGILWSPSYQLALPAGDANEGILRLSAKAIVMNDLVDLENTHVDLVTGFPHMPMAGVNFALGSQTVMQYVQQLNNTGSDRGYASNRVMTQQIMMNAPAYRSGRPSMPSMPAQGDQTEDLYFYPLGAVTLKKGERGYFPLFATDIPYRHLYTWDIPDMFDNNGRYNRYGRDNENYRDIVWHSLELTNAMDMPWTTGPAQTTKQGRMLGQDTMFYTAAGTKTEVKINHALNIQPTQKESEVERKRNAVTFHGSSYDQITIEGELCVVNRTGRDVDMRITKEFRGELIVASDNAEHSRDFTGLRGVNPENTLTWKLKVKAGKDNEVKLKYRYTVYWR